MCLTIKLNRKIKTEKEAIAAYKNIATEDFYVFKSLKYSMTGYTSPIRASDIEYNAGVHYYQVGEKFTFEFHRYNNGERFLNVHVGLHAYTCPNRANTRGAMAICRIPKGSTYFVSYENDEIVTDNLIIDEIINLKK